MEIILGLLAALAALFGYGWIANKRRVEYLEESARISEFEMNRNKIRGLIQRMSDDELKKNIDDSLHRNHGNGD